ncbi:MAG: hypothetical protein JWO05_1457 [Gemmatimonadetes bacterium]|nr:hypothetical protein [Gemmatimonadota bacterium]
MATNPANAALSVTRAERFSLGVIALGALCVIVLASPYKLFELDRFFVPKELVLHATAAIALLALIERARRLHVRRMDLLLAAFLVLGLASSVFATNRWLATRSLAITVSGIALFWVARALGRKGLDGAVVAAIAVGTMAAAITALLQTYGVHSSWFSLNRAPGGTLGNRNFVAHLAAIGIPLMVTVALRGRSAGRTVLACAGSAVLAAALILSRSRGAYLAVGAAAFVLLACAKVAHGRVRGVRRVLPLLASAVLGAAVAVVVPNTLDWKSDSPYLDSAKGLVNYRKGSGKGRLVQYANSVRMSLAHPVLGVGPGNWAVTYPRFASPDDPSLSDENGMTANPWPSSDLVAFLAERGLPGFIALIGALALMAWSALGTLRRHDDEEAVAMAMGLLATLAAALVVGAFDAVLLLAAPSLLVWTALGAMSACGAPSPEKEVQVAPAAARGGTILVLLVGALMVLRSTGQLTAMDLYSKSSRASTLARAARMDPGNYRLRIRAAQAFYDQGQCKGVNEQGGAAHSLFPNAPAPRRLLANCR